MKLHLVDRLSRWLDHYIRRCGRGERPDQRNNPTNGTPAKKDIDQYDGHPIVVITVDGNDRRQTVNRKHDQERNQEDDEVGRSEEVIKHLIQPSKCKTILLWNRPVARSALC